MKANIFPAISTVLLATISACSTSTVGPPGPVPLKAGGLTDEKHNITGGTQFQRSRLGIAVDAVATMWKDESFWALVKKQMWLPGPEETAISGDEVASYLRPLSPESQVYHIARLGWAMLLLPSGTIAKTAVCGTVTVNRPHVSGTTYLVNTVAHEITHTIGRGERPRGCSGDDAMSYRFTDGGYGRDTKPWLVSYAFGDLAQCFDDTGGAEQEALTCFERRVNGEQSCRLWEECCVETSNEYVLEIRQKTGRCSAVQCTTEAALCPEN